MKNYVNLLRINRDLDSEGLKELLLSGDYDEELFAAADNVRQGIYGKDVYIRGLIEISNYCKNDCYYCGIRRSNDAVDRYRLSKEDILACCEEGYELGFRTFVLQGGEDGHYSVEDICDIVAAIHEKYPDCAITLSLGEYAKEDYAKMREAGATRYLLRHETATEEHYQRLHPESMLLSKRKACLYSLKELGYQVGSGFMVGSPYQTIDHIIADLRFLQELKPDMIGMGPFLPAENTPFAKYPEGALMLTVRLLAVLRLMFPYATIPATTALGTLDPKGRELGLKAGANVVMPNLSPSETRAKYALYNNKISAGAESAQSLSLLQEKVEAAGYKIAKVVGDPKKE